MNIRRTVAILSLLLTLAGGLAAGCFDDHDIIEKHEQALEDDE
ncbi:MAG: hypothetical protein O7D94_00325 [Planctomycetota bacterium]|nr:hypothetical protein [Planctomycetota bacterium]